MRKADGQGTGLRDHALNSHSPQPPNPLVTPLAPWPPRPPRSFTSVLSSMVFLGFIVLRLPPLHGSPSHAQNQVWGGKEAYSFGAFEDFD